MYICRPALCPKHKVHRAPHYADKSLMGDNHAYVYFMFPAEALFVILIGTCSSPSTLPFALFIHLNTHYDSPVCDHAGWSLTFCPFFVCVLHLRPGCCAGHGPAASFKSSIEFPDDTLQFIKSHPLMDTAVPSIGDEPWFTKTRVR